MNKYKIDKYKKIKDKTSKYQHLATFEKNCQYYNIKSKNEMQKYNVEI